MGASGGGEKLGDVSGIAVGSDGAIAGAIVGEGAVVAGGEPNGDPNV